MFCLIFCKAGVKSHHPIGEKKTIDCAHFFFIIATEKIKPALDKKIPPKIIGVLNVDKVYLNIAKKKVFPKNIWKKSKNVPKLQKIPTFSAFIL